ncbi:hypothetical protein MESS2_1710014 [Mesorhizobium metallidurans STM 2683]|uniref:Uncharacterized protein n=1 Tax=Mesorhizobium metallidurans STM 2683 TaxID=1297569 RepID=M5ENK5_9HYPH|nr:hypothetical protein MESS2_1710014 [Mesorhizobium metallidurans STM 2683]
MLASRQRPLRPVARQGNCQSDTRRYRRQACRPRQCFEKVKTQKTTIRDFLFGENSREKVDAWLPRWMKFPGGKHSGSGRGWVLAMRRVWVADLR